MSWIALALLSAATYGVVAVLDKRLLDKYVPSLSSYFVWVGLATLLYGVVFLGIGGIPEDAPTDRLIIGAVSGLSWGGALAMMFWGFKLQEVSRASAVLFTFPVFVAIIASVFLEESLIAAQWLAITVVVGGALLVSLINSPTKYRLLNMNKYWASSDPNPQKLVQLNKAFPILIVSSLLTASGHLTGKYALQELSIPLVTSLGFFGTAAVFLLFWRANTFSHLRQTMKHKEAILLLILSEGILVPIAVTSMIAATKLGPISLVATISGSRPIFVFIYSTILSLPGIRLLNESIDKRTLTIKFASVVMIVFGIMLL